MAYIPAYDKPYLATVLLDAKQGFLCVVDRLTWGPIFPFFIKADFLTYEGFRDFIRWVGIDGLIYLDDPKQGEMVAKSLKQKKLDRLVDISNEKCIPVSYIQKFYDHILDSLLEEQNNMRSFCSIWLRKQFPVTEKLPTDKIDEAIDQSIDAVHQHLSGVKITLGYGYESANKGDERYRLAYSKRNGYSLRDYYSDILKSGTRNHESPQRKKPYWYFHYETLPARCYMEMIDILQDDREAKLCAYCGEVFIPKRKNEEFCKRLAPEYRSSGGPRTCKQIGPQRRFQKDKSQEELERIRQRKQFQNRLLYLKKKGKRKKYRIVMAEFERWKKKTNHRNSEKK